MAVLYACRGMMLLVYLICCDLLFACGLVGLLGLVGFPVAWFALWVVGLRCGWLTCGVALRVF